MENKDNNSNQAYEHSDISANVNTEPILTLPDSENALQENADKVEDENVKTNSINSNETKLTHLPLSRIKHIMKLDSDITIVPLECVFLVTKATELFVQSLAREACSFTQQNDKKTLQRKDIESAISQVDSLVFLEETL